MNKRISLGFYYHIPALQKQGKIYMPGYIGCFLDTLADHFEKLTLFQHLPDLGDNSSYDYEIKSANVNLVSLPPRRSVPYRVLHSKKFIKQIKENSDELDAILLRGPTPLLPSIANSFSRIPAILLIIGDQVAGVDSLPQPRWRKELIRLWSWYNAESQLQVARRSLVFVNSRSLYHKFETKVDNLIETHTTTINTSDIFERHDTCTTRPIRLLYTGRLDPAKGLMDMVEALSILVTQEEDVVIDFVGWPEKGSTIMEQIQQLGLKNQVADRIFFHGYKPVGSELFAFYKQADIYLIASQSSEGFPRTIWEAMAHSLPVVATKVGSIPDFISGSAELVNPKNVSELASGISRIIHNSKIRQDYIAKGLVLAHQNSLENQVGEMARVIKDWVESLHE